MADLDFDSTISAVDNPVTMVVPSTSPEVIESGMKKVVVKKTGRNQRAGYAIFTKVCVACGTEVDHGTSELENSQPCPRCHGVRYRGIAALAPDTVANVLNTDLRYECQTCHALYATPTPCCLANHLAQGAGLQSGYMCLGCQKIYDRRVACCSNAKLIPGHYYFADKAEYLAKPKLLLPV